MDPAPEASPSGTVHCAPGVHPTSVQVTLVTLSDRVETSMTGFVQLRFFGHRYFPIKKTPFIDDQLGRANVSFDHRFSFEHDLVRSGDRASHFPADRDILRRDVPVDLTRDSDGNAFTRRDLTGELPIDSNVSLAADFPFYNRSRAYQVEFFDRISFQSQGSFRSLS